MIVNVKKAALWLGQSERNIRELCKKEKFKGAYQSAGYSGQWAIPLEALEAICPCPDELRDAIFADLAKSKRGPVKHLD